MSLKPPPRNFSKIKLPKKIIETQELYRISGYSSGEPHFGKTANNRFDDRSRTKKNRFGTCYFGFDLETAIAETILHDEMPEKGVFSIAYERIDSRYLVRLKKKSLVLANLTGASLKILVGDGSLSTILPYDIPQRWAMAVHRHPDHVDGIYYMSRHINNRPAVVLFERVKNKLACASIKKLTNVSGIMEAVKNLHIAFKF